MTERERQNHAVSEPSGFAIGYARGKGSFRVYITSALAIGFAAVAASTGNAIAIALAATFAVVSFYFYPLIEHGRARFGANEYGIFIEGFGLVAWRGVGNLRISTRAVRNIEINELVIELSRPIGGAIIDDWRSLSWSRLLMRLPWRMPNDSTIMIDLEPFGDDPAGILEELKRRWRYFGR